MKTKTMRANPGAAAPTSATLTLRAPEDVLTAIPYLLGYHPKDSVVVIVMRGKQLHVTIRRDLPPTICCHPGSHDAPGGASCDETDDSIGLLVQFVRERRGSAVIVVGYGSDDRVRPTVTGLREAFDHAGIRVLEALWVDGGRFRSYYCPDPTCCPWEGWRYDPSTGPVAAEATFAGRVALADRAAYEAQLAPIDGPSRVAMAHATARADERLFELLTDPPDDDDTTDEWPLLAAGRAAIANAVARQRDGGRLDDDEVAWLSVLLTSAPVREYAWRSIAGPPEVLEQHRALWMDVVRRAEPALLAAPGTLCALAAWRCGEVTLARIALDRALVEEPDYWLANTLEECLARGLPPSTFRSVFHGRSTAGDRRRPGRRPRRRSSKSRTKSRRG